MRIAFTNKDIQAVFQKNYPSATYLTVDGESICEHIGRADIFIVDPQIANEMAANCDADARPSIFIAIDEKSPLPAAFQEGYVDDILVLPLRALDVHRIIRMHENLVSLREVEKTSKGIPQLVKKLQEDISLAQKIQRRLIKDKFPPMGGLSIKSKYWCGLKSGGDYFDVFEFPDGNHVGIILSDSSSYSLSTQLLGSLMQFSAHVGAKEKNDPGLIVKSLFGKLQDALKEKDQLSLFYGVLDRKTFELRYVECGTVFVQWQNKEEKKWVAQGLGKPLSLQNIVVPETKEVSIEPGDRLILLSDGWTDGLANGIKDIPEEVEAHDLITELSFRLRKNVEKNLDPDEVSEEFPMPPQDCSVVVIDIAKNLLRLAK